MPSHSEEKQPKAMDTSIKVALIGAAATLAAALITVSIAWQQQPSAAQEKRADLTLDRILDILQRHRQRATFGAVAGALGREPLNLFDGYPRTPRTAWVVSKGTGQPTGQKQSELPPDLLTNAHVITTSLDSQGGEIR